MKEESGSNNTPHDLPPTTALTVAPLAQAVAAQFALPLRCVHGIAHWARVLENGLRLAPLTGADAQVVGLFAMLHDARRRNNSHDPDHGKRAAGLAATLRGKCFFCSDRQFEQLAFACAHHTDGHTDGDVTAQTCWCSFSPCCCTWSPVSLLLANRSRRVLSACFARAREAGTPHWLRPLGCAPERNAERAYGLTHGHGVPKFVAPGPPRTGTLPYGLALK